MSKHIFYILGPNVHVIEVSNDLMHMLDDMYTVPNGYSSSISDFSPVDIRVFHG